MRYIDRRFLLPVAAATAFAQQQSPEAATAEAALRTRAEQFFQLQVDKKFRQAESMVADDTKDAYYNGNKFNIKSFKIQRIELSEENTHARVTILAKVTILSAGIPPMDFDAPDTTLWKLENGEWVWYVDPRQSVQTPFGTITPGAGTPGNLPLPRPQNAPTAAALLNAVKLDHDTVELMADGPSGSVAVINGFSGAVDVEVEPELSALPIPGLTWKLDRKHLESGQKATIELKAAGEGKRNGIVHVLVSPTAAQLDIRINVK